MKTFVFQANCEFEAENLSDAAEKLIKHFAAIAMSDAIPGEDLEFVGRMELAKK